MSTPLLRRLVIGLLIATTIVAFFVLDLGRYLSLDFLHAQHGVLQAWRNEQPLIAAASFFTIYVLATALSVPGAVVLTLAVVGAYHRLVCLDAGRDGRLPRCPLSAARCD